MKNLIEVKKLFKEYNDSTGYTTVLFEDLNFTIERSKVTCLLAPTGSGKTSLLKILAGLESESAGEINNSSKRISYIPNDSSIFPWLNVKQNIIYNLPGVTKTEINDVINFVGLDGYEDHFSHPGSYGFRFRTSLARSIVRRPDLIILDEPFELIKSSIRQSLLELTRKISSGLGTAILLATTNISRAIFLSDKIYLMDKNPGKIIDEFNISFDTDRDSRLYSFENYKSAKKIIVDKIESTVSSHEHEFTL